MGATGATGDLILRELQDFALNVIAAVVHYRGEGADEGEEGDALECLLGELESDLAELSPETREALNGRNRELGLELGLRAEAGGTEA